MFIIIVFRLGGDWPSGLLFFMLALLFSTFMPVFSPSLSVSLPYFILAVPIHECLRKHLYISSALTIGYSHTEGYLIFSQNDMIEMVEGSPVKS